MWQKKLDVHHVVSKLEVVVSCDLPRSLSETFDDNRQLQLRHI